MAEPKTPPLSPGLDEDAGFPPLPGNDDLADTDRDDLDSEYHEDGGGD